jgi:hypothetical protein
MTAARSEDIKPLDEIATVVDNWRAARAKEAEWKRAKEELAAAILAVLGDAELGTIAGRPVVSYKRIKKTALSQKLLQRLHPDVFAECVETTESNTGLRLVES